jgi:DNA-binding PadR family transcriptional regulator
MRMFKWHHRCEAHDDQSFPDERRFARGEGWPHEGRGHGFGHRHRFGGRGGLGRLFAHGDLHLVMLHLIDAKPRHGYELIKAIEEMVGGVYTPSPGTVYPALTMLEDQGYVTVEAGEGNKKLYSITEAGKAYLDLNRRTVEALLTHMAEIGASQEGGHAPQIVRAIENLRLALRLRLSRGRLSDDEVRALTEILDRAAGEIERS